MAINETVGLYDLTNVTNSENILEFTQAVNTLTDGWLMILVLIAGFIIFTMAQWERGVDKAIAASGFMTVILSVMFMLLSFISIPIMATIAVLYGIVLVITTTRNS